jgi:hypothetical protein
MPQKPITFFNVAERKFTKPISKYTVNEYVVRPRNHHVSRSVTIAKATLPNGQNVTKILKNKPLK